MFSIYWYVIIFIINAYIEIMRCSFKNFPSFQNRYFYSVFKQIIMNNNNNTSAGGKLCDTNDHINNYWTSSGWIICFSLFVFCFTRTIIKSLLNPWYDGFLYQWTRNFLQPILLLLLSENLLVMVRRFCFGKKHNNINKIYRYLTVCFRRSDGRSDLL